MCLFVFSDLNSQTNHSLNKALKVDDEVAEECVQKQSDTTLTQ